MFSTAFILLIFSISADFVFSVGPTVKTDCGQIEGKEINTSKGKCDAYLGVPFAEKPVGPLRWQKPKKAECWQGTFNATKFGPRCIQAGSNGTSTSIFEDSEDCLYLNVFVPQPTPPATKLPVMVFIHGGAFVFGSAQDYGQEGPCENLATRGVVLVIIQYRLGMYGFFSSGDNAALGNYGIWDQVQALTWVKENIGSFGGDPNQVTIFGESAGGASVSYLTYTPVAKDYFQRSIAESGSALSFWGQLSDASIASAKALAKTANCSSSDSNTYVNCLRQLKTPELQTFFNSMSNGSMFSQWPWATRVDGEMFTQSKLEDLKTGKPAIIGVNTLEMAIPDEKSIPMAKAIFDQTLNNTFDSKNTEQNEVLKQIAYYVYVDSKGDRNDDKFVCQQLSKFQSDVMFHAAAAQEAESKAVAGSPVWVYNFDYWSDNVFKPSYIFEKGAPHAHELCYLFLLYVPPEAEQFLICPKNYDGKYREIADQLGEMWTNFAIKGDPSPKNIAWPQFKNVSSASAMTIRSALTIEPHFYLDIANFWNYLKPNIEAEFADEPVTSVTPPLTPVTTPSAGGSAKLEVSFLLFVLTIFTTHWIYAVPEN